MDTTSALIVGTWLHSHEEDTPTERVYRRADFAFPPSRGRNGYQFLPDHTGAYLGIAACYLAPHIVTNGADFHKSTLRSAMIVALLWQICFHVTRPSSKVVAMGKIIRRTATVDHH